MSSAAGSANAPNPPGGGAADNSAQGSRHRQDRRGGRGQGNGPERLKGKREQLKGLIYDINASGANLFSKTNREVAEHIASTAPEAGELRSAMIEMEMADLDEPARPTAVSGAFDPIDMEVWKEEHRLCTKKREKREEIKSQVLPITLGQCHPPLRERAEADVNWNAINDDNDTI